MMSVWHIKGEDAAERLLKDNILQIPQPWMPFFNFELAVSVEPESGDIIDIDSDDGTPRRFMLRGIRQIYEAMDGEETAVKNYDCQYVELIDP